MTRLRLLFLLPLLSLIYFFIFFSLLEAILTIFVFICVVYIFLARFYYDDFVTIINYSLAQLPTTREFDINDHSEKDYNITSPEPWENAYFQKKFKIEKKGNFLLKRPCNNTKIEFVTNMEVFGEYDNFSKKLRKIDMPRYTKTTRVKKIFVGNNKTLEYLIRATTRNIIDSIIISKCTFRSDLNGNSKPNYRLSCRRKFDTFLVHKSIGELLNFEKLVSEFFYLFLSNICIDPPFRSDLLFAKNLKYFRSFQSPADL